MASMPAPSTKPVAATAGPGGVQQVTIGATNMFRFSPAVVTAHPGELRVKLVDTGSYPHNLSVDGLHITSMTVTGEPGQSSTTFTLRFGKPGTYPFKCTFHSSAGMRGEFVIS
jgi:plastocyanin